jgi:hypothetical protein
VVSEIQCSRTADGQIRTPLTAKTVRHAREVREVRKVRQAERNANLTVSDHRACRRTKAPCLVAV